MTESNHKLVRDYGATIFAAILVALFIRFFVIEAYRIPSAAMKPTLEPGDTIFVAKWPFGLRLPYTVGKLNSGRLPVRGEVVVFTLPGETKRDYIKRVIGLPGDRIEVKKGQVLLNGHTLRVNPSSNSPCTEERIPEGRAYEICVEPPLNEDFGPQTVPSRTVFVIGDFRSLNIADRATELRPRESKMKGWGMIPVDSLKGLALWVWLSIEPHAIGAQSGWFPQFRFDRMFRRVE